MPAVFIPKIILSFREGYALKNFRSDLLAGLMVGILSIPMAIAFAIASGARPEQGIITSIIAGGVASLTTGSRYQITGPTGAFVVLIAGIINNCGYECLVMATLLAGIFLLAIGFTRLGFVIKFIPYPVTIGFTSGIALLIFTSQIPDFLGLKLEKFPAEFWSKWYAIFSHLSEIHWQTLTIGALSLFIITFWRKLKTPFPGSLAAIIFSVMVCWFFNLDIETIGNRFGEIKFSLAFYNFKFPAAEEIDSIISSAIAITLLAGIESLLSCVVADGMTGRRHNSNMELVSQGFANIASALAGGLPATGAIARTATNIKTGAFSPVSALINALTVAVLLLYFGSFVSMIPFATLAAILIMIAYNMSEWHLFVRLFKSPASDVSVLLITFFLTVLVDLVTAIEVGVILAAFLFIHRMVESTQFAAFAHIKESEAEEEFDLLKELQIPEDIQLFEIQGPLFFAAAEKFKMALGQISPSPRILILRMKHLMHIDATGLRALEDIVNETKKTQTRLLLSGITHSKPIYNELKKSGILDRLGENGVFPNIKAAVTYAKNIL